MNKQQQLEKLNQIVPKYFGGDYIYVGYVENRFEEPFIIFQIQGHKIGEYFVTGSELGWDSVVDYLDNRHWFSSGDERVLIDKVIQKYVKKEFGIIYKDGHFYGEEGSSNN